MPVTVHPLDLRISTAYLVETPGRLLLVDAGMRHQEQAIVRAMRRIGRSDLKLILITHAHADHYGSAAALTRLTGAPVAIHADDAPAMAAGQTRVRGRTRLQRAAMPVLIRLIAAPAVQADLLLNEGDTLELFGLPGRILHMPGHTPGSCCLLLPDGTAFAGDLVLTSGQPHLQRAFIDDREQLWASYLRLRGLDLERVYGGHGRRPLTRDELRQVIDAEIGSLGRSDKGS
jgi:glyoxylase-like metal-dependent hydrolase (beta-lactamase superfamily II)